MRLDFEQPEEINRLRLSSNREYYYDTDYLDKKPYLPRYEFDVDVLEGAVEDPERVERAVAAMDPDEKIRNPDAMARQFLSPAFWFWTALYGCAPTEVMTCWKGSSSVSSTLVSSPPAAFRWPAAPRPVGTLYARAPCDRGTDVSDGVHPNTLRAVWKL